jgi:tetratricopeptide (TPR) repeat protein
MNRYTIGLRVFVATVALVGPSVCPQVGAETASAAQPMLIRNDLGTIDFPNDGAQDAQQAFLTGVKALYSFEFNEAADAFRIAQATDPGFALAYWGEAISYNHALWQETDPGTALSVLNKFAPSPKARQIKTPAGIQRGLMSAVDTLFGNGNKLRRDIAYSEAMQNLHQAYPDDNEVAALYSLSILGTVRQGDKGVGRQMHAAAIAQSVLTNNPNHPGAAHFIIHALDDPEHAVLALPAARTYAGIAPGAPHALHMPSHIFVQLGMWEDVVSSNIKSYEAAEKVALKNNMERGRSEFHSLSWLLYGYTQLGNFTEAKAALELAKKTEKDSPTRRVHNGAMAMLARYVVETENWTELAGLSSEKKNYKHLDLQFALGLSAAKRGDLEKANNAATHLKALRENTRGQQNGVYRAKIITISELEVQAAIATAQNDMIAAEEFLKNAVAIEATLNAPSGPPLPVKPSFEMYGEFLLAAGRMSEAAEQFEQSLLRTPNRTKSVSGLKKATQELTDEAEFP